MNPRDECQPHASNPPPCPALIDLAALADDRLSEADSEHVLVHAAMCARCAEFLSELRSDRDAIEIESRLLLVPQPIVHAAMSLRSAGEVHTTGFAQTSWSRVLLRAGALAACIALMFVGYHVGGSFSAVQARDSSSGIDEAHGMYAFGLLEEPSELNSDNSLFAFAFAAHEAGTEAGQEWEARP